MYQLQIEMKNAIFSFVPCKFSYFLYFLVWSENITSDNAALFSMNFKAAQVPTYSPENGSSELLEYKNASALCVPAFTLVCQYYSS